jgi:drug/metabolite transporter (DMT)-like permease
VLALAVLSTVVAYVIYYRILATAGSVNLMLVTFLIPITGILLGALVLGERLAMRHFLGMAAIGIGLACIDGRLIRRISRLTIAR